MKSNCCQAQLWVACGNVLYNPDAEWLPTQTCYYVCRKCLKACDGVEEK